MTENKKQERENNSLEKVSFEQVPTSRAADRVLRRRRKSRGLFHKIFRNILRLVRNTSNR
jgi:hypothetical protein